MIIKMNDIPQKLIYNKKIITLNSISAFLLSSKEKNDENNSMREKIIESIINQKIPPLFFENLSSTTPINEVTTFIEEVFQESKDFKKEWYNIKESIQKYINELVNDRPYKTIQCIHKAGRKNNYDFLFQIGFLDNNTENFPIELKFNASSIKETPQYVSPMKPSQYLSSSYEEFYYDNYMSNLSTVFELPVPPKDIWLKQIHSNSPICMKEYKIKYDQGCKSSSKFSNNEKAPSSKN